MLEVLTTRQPLVFAAEIEGEVKVADVFGISFFASEFIEISSVLFDFFDDACPQSPQNGSKCFSFHGSSLLFSFSLSTRSLSWFSGVNSPGVKTNQ